MCFVNKLLRCLEVHGQSHIELAACEVVGHGILDAVHVGHPVVTAHVADVEQVECVNAQPDALEVAKEATRGLVSLAQDEIG